MDKKCLALTFFVRFIDKIISTNRRTNKEECISFTPLYTLYLSFFFSFYYFLSFVYKLF